MSIIVAEYPKSIIGGRPEYRIYVLNCFSFFHSHSSDSPSGFTCLKYDAHSFHSQGLLADANYHKYLPIYTTIRPHKSDGSSHAF